MRREENKREEKRSEEKRREGKRSEEKKREEKRRENNVSVEAPDENVRKDAFLYVFSSLQVSGTVAGKEGKRKEKGG